MKVRLKYLSEDVDRHGNVRCYVRVPGKPKVRLRSQPGSPNFMDEYRAAFSLAAESVTVRTLARGTFGYLCNAYFASQAFRSLDKSTQSWRRRALNELVERHGDKRVSTLQARHIRKLRDEKRVDGDGAANIRVKALRALFRWAVEADEATSDPARDVQLIRYVTRGFHTWSIDEVAAFEKRHPIGTKAHLALSILLYTACRREDAVRLGPQHLRDGRIKYTQAKNENRNPVTLDIPAHPDLVASIEAAPSGHLTFLATEYGRPFTVAGFGNWFRDRCNEAGLPHCTAHGLRKATATRLAERGATAHQIMAVTGHKTLQEAERYTRAARQAQLADAAMAKLK
ncbi:MAG: tyrosine-type recombinase/integrase [Pseudolabrys sp.]|nr:tyrosine-type recombinase/integrase [Pseudolabrys sp.]